MVKWIHRKTVFGAWMDRDDKQKLQRTVLWRSLPVVEHISHFDDIVPIAAIGQGVDASMHFRSKGFEMVTCDFSI